MFVNYIVTRPILGYPGIGEGSTLLIVMPYGELSRAVPTGDDCMAGAISLISVFAGTVVAYASERLPSQRETLEYAGGILLVSGLSVLGGALRFFC